MKYLNKMSLGILMVLNAIVIPIDSYAQWSFRESIHYSGRCEDIMGGLVNAINAQIPDISGFATRAECEAARAYINSIRSSYGGCTVYASASPCVGHDIGGGSVAGIANPTVGASSQGSSFFYTSVPEEVKNWQAEQDRIDALIGNRSDNPVIGLASTSDGSFNASLNNDISRLSFGSAPVVNIGNGVFTGIPDTPLQPVGQNADMATVLSYLGQLDNEFYDYLLTHPSDIFTLLPQKFKELTGLDIDVVVNKPESSRTPEEQQAIDNYNAFVSSICSEVQDLATKRLTEIDSSPEKKEVDMAILAKICYNDDENGYETLTNYHSVDFSELTGNTNLISLFEAIDHCNATENETGLHIEFYKNDLTGEYTVAFQGTKFSDLKGDVSTDIEMLGNLTPEQFKQLGGLIQAIKDCGGDINITGHSLGGALASYVGLQTGRDTYTFNAFGLNQTLLKTIPNYDDSKIKAYRSSSELLVTVGQEVIPTTIQAGGAVARTAGAIGSFPSSEPFKMTIPGQRIPVEDGGLHGSGPMVEQILKRNSGVQNDWFEIRANRKAMSQYSQDSSLYRQDGLLIISY